MIYQSPAILDLQPAGKMYLGAQCQEVKLPAGLGQEPQASEDRSS